MRTVRNYYRVAKITGEDTMELPPQLINWLYNVLQPQYEHKQLIYTHIIQFLQRFYPKFKIRTKVYTSSYSGATNLLINLHGKLTRNNVPIEIWVPLNYPFTDDSKMDGESGVPIIFVVPDNENGVYLKPNNHVDSQGRVYHPYLTDWYKQSTNISMNLNPSFNLISLINYLTESFEGDCPITNESSHLYPPKPSKIPLNENEGSSTIVAPLSSIPTGNLSQTNTGSRSSNGPPLPAKPVVSSNSSIPLKYQSPLPLPRQSTSSGKGFSAPPQQHSNINSTIPGYVSPPSNAGIMSGGYTSSSPRPQSDSPQHQLDPRQRAAPYPHIASPPNYESIFRPEGSGSSHKVDRQVSSDLMDRDDRANSSSIQSDKLNKVSEEINKLLTKIPENTSVLESLNTNKLKIEGLYDQLTHHYNQANANKDFLQSHFNYLSNQLSKITQLNSSLGELQALNSDDKNHIYFMNGKVSLDELVVADSVLTNQLYDTVSEIKANKDTIGLIGGNFSGGSELICDESFDACMRSVRNIGRDLFWLELIKDEIVNKMGLHAVA